MTLTHYQPWSLHRALLDEISRSIDNASDANVGASATDAHVGTGSYAPAVDIAESADKFVLTADLPGVDPATVEITLENGVLTLSGSREKTVGTAGVESRRSERQLGKFHRRFALPDTVDGESVTAAGKHGVLEITIPKRAAVQPRRIAVTH